MLTATTMLFLQSASIAVSHPGGLNAEGCHNNRKTGEYHCHRKKPKKPSRAEPPIMPIVDLSSAPDSRPFANCAAARAAGAAPVRIGDPGYGTWLDRDRDGIGCE